MRRRQLTGGALIAALAVLVGVGLWQTGRQNARRRIALVRHPQRIMGTTCTLTAVAPHRAQARAEQALREAEAALRAVEARTSTWLADSETSRLNAADAEEEVPLSADSLQVLRAARQAAVRTAGAFDVTCRPLVELWTQAGKRGRLPTQAELDQSRAATGWHLVELTDKGAIKRSDQARVDLGGIAKGYGIDRAIEALRRAGMAGGLVDVGGDLRCFGQPPAGEYWPVDVKSPFAAQRLGELRLSGGAVCTSGNYARFTAIQSRRYSHIIDPRSGWPADAVPSVTVAAPAAMRADIWATALSVLGRDGFERLPQGVEAMVVLGSGDNYRICCTAGFRDLIQEPLPERLTVWQAGK